MQNFELFNKILKEVEAERVSLSVDNEYGVFKYKDKCQYDKEWNDINQKCRGMVWHMPTKTLVAYPFDKFWNLNEFDHLKVENLPFNKEHIIWEKLDGSMVSVFLDIDENIKCSTGGSLISEQSKWASDWLKRKILSYPTIIDVEELLIEKLKHHTFIFEAIYPSNLIVVNYDNREDLVLLAVRKLNGHELHPNAVDEIARQFNFSRPKRYNFIIDGHNSIPFEPNAEGYVVHWPELSLRVKIKGEEYTQLHRLRSTFSLKGVCEALAESNYGKLYSVLPPHLRMIADDLAAELRTKFFALKADVIEAFNKIKDLPTRKDKALKIKESFPKRIWPHIYCSIDNHLTDRDLWMTVYNEI